MSVKNRVIDLIRAERKKYEVSVEVWKTIPDFPDYQVSNFGRVRSLKNTKVRTLKSSKGCNGYLHVNLSKDGIKRCKLLNRLVLTTFIGEPPLNFQASHLDGSRDNNRLDNLRWESPQDNTLRKRLHGTDNKGERHNLAIITNDDVREIRRLSSLGYSQRKLAKMYGFSGHSSISYILRGQYWSHVK